MTMSMQRPESFLRRGLFGAEAGRKWLWMGVTVLVLAGVAVMARGLPWAQTWQALVTARPGWAIAALAINCAMFPLWASQWRLLAPRTNRPSWGRMLEIVSLISLSQNVLPLIGSAAACIGMLIFRGGMSRGAAVSLLAIDQMLTGLAKVAALGAAALLVRMPGWIREGGMALVAVMVVFVVALLMLAHGTERLDKLAQRLGRGARVAASLAAWTRHLEGLRRGGRRVWWALGYALLKKVCEAAAAISIQYACGIELGWGGAILVVAALGLSTLVRTPGNLGVYEATVVGIYSALGAPPAPALAAALLQHLVVLLPRMGFGLIVLLVRPGISLRQR
jgi:uncharacterized membrane protein YbhN (UPF0104 family)